jgi:hypothetical protein
MRLSRAPETAFDERRNGGAPMSLLTRKSTTARTTRADSTKLR